MAEFLTTKGTSYYIESIMINANKELVLVSPYLQLSKTFYERLNDAYRKNVKINIIYGKDELKPNEKNSIAQLGNVKLYFFENLHAKCYYNESSMVITSMNMYEFSEKNNREMGVYITRDQDLELYLKAVDEVNSILQSSEVTPFSKTDRHFYSNRNNRKNDSDGSSANKNQNRGYCIRCEKRISFDPERPYCWECYSIWAHYENIEYEENVCHSCGEFGVTTMIKPLCYSCYKEMN